ncbi:MAG: glycoside hydrolase family 127 protein, partial [Firmicutes bacterium]|nr:glycoside hydrolase family 127 protein [Bacillota bacterium]
NNVLPYQWLALNDLLPDAEPSHAIMIFKIAAGEAGGQFGGYCFQDSDVFKWLEAVGYLLAQEADPDLAEKADQVIELIARAQQPDGYLNTYFTVAEPGRHFTNLRDCHELYCAGHLFEAAVAYYEATGKTKLLEVACHYADHIDRTFGPDPGKKKGYDGHPEIELALVKLYRATGEERYLRLSKYFIDERGRQPHYFDLEAEERGDTRPYWNIFGHSYSQSHLPVREQKTAEGHAVRAMYLYSAVADVAALTGDESLAEACKVLWENVTNRRMYITGAVGSSAYGESFTIDYDLPNDRAYAETCATIGLVFWAHRMLHLEMDAKYADVMERALYNGVLSGISLDGERFFYVNPLAVWPEACARRHDLQHVKVTRQKWFACACCPPNLARLIASLGKYIYSYSEEEKTVYAHLFTGSTARFDLTGEEITITQKSAYPWEGEVEFEVNPAKETEFTLAVRIPGWCRGAELVVNGSPVSFAPFLRRGYVYLKREWHPGDRVLLRLPMPVERVYAHPRVRANAGRVALQRGPLVYCLEEIDNGPNLPGILLPVEAEVEARYLPDFLGGVVVLETEGLRLEEEAWEGGLYSPVKPKTRRVKIRAIPYFVWNNRGPGEMLVWIREA